VIKACYHEYVLSCYGCNLKPVEAIFSVCEMLHHFDHLALVYDRLLGRPKLAVIRDLLRLPVSGLMLDEGGGTARVSYPLRAHVGRVVIADMSLPMLRQAKRKGRLWTVKSDAEGLPFSDESFERVLIVDAFHHFADQEQSVGEMVRVLKKGGRMVIEEPDVRRWPVKVAALAEKLLLMKSRFLPPPSIVEMIGRHGLSAQVEESDRFRVWIVADKYPQEV
jgi:ubiquinone/menaquinone biosynthesis C-methylase UbiE